MLEARSAPASRSERMPGLRVRRARRRCGPGESSHRDAGRDRHRDSQLPSNATWVHGDGSSRYDTAPDVAGIAATDQRAGIEGTARVVTRAGGHPIHAVWGNTAEICCSVLSSTPCRRAAVRWCSRRCVRARPSRRTSRPIGAAQRGRAQAGECYVVLDMHRERALCSTGPVWTPPGPPACAARPPARRGPPSQPDRGAVSRRRGHRTQRPGNRTAGLEPAPALSPPGPRRTRGCRRASRSRPVGVRQVRASTAQASVRPRCGSGPGSADGREGRPAPRESRKGPEDHSSGPFRRRSPMPRRPVRLSARPSRPECGSRRRWPRR